ncbi:MAG: type II toxin-antitoxin system VapC family toxin [Candidatus Omnitrophota bacterium]
MKAEAVIDASVAASWFSPDEAASKYNHVVENIDKVKLFSPLIFEYELLNIILNSYRRGRISYEVQQDIFNVIRHYHVTMKTPSNHFVDSLVVFDLAREHKLTIYDAAYLSLAIELEVPLLTLDKALLAATHVLRIRTDI